MVELEQKRAIEECKHRINSRMAKRESIEEEYKM